MFLLPGVSFQSAVVPEAAGTAGPYDGVCVYVASFLITLFPYVLHHTMDLPQTLGNIFDALQRFNGLGNVLAHALNSMLARGTVLAPEVSGDCVSADNEFEQWAGVQNVRVAFNEWEHEEHMVARVQRIALQRSESEIASLEQARAGSIDSEA